MGEGILVDKRAALTLALAMLGACTTPPSLDPPRAIQQADLPSSERIAARRLQPVPGLTEGADVAAFLNWLGSAPADTTASARRSVEDAGKRPDVVNALIREAEQTHRIDYTRALLTLAVLGETRSDTAVAYLEQFVSRQLPDTGTRVDGQIAERTQQAQLQAKAVDGLAYANTEASNAAVKHIIRHHPSRIVRAEAINAYLWNRGDTEEAKRELSAVVRPDEALFLERVRKLPGEGRESFDAKVETFARHLEVPPPARGTGRHRADLPTRNFEGAPPPF